MHRYLDRQVRLARKVRLVRLDPPDLLEVLVRPAGLGLWVHLELQVRQVRKAHLETQAAVRALKAHLVRKVRWDHLVPKVHLDRKARKAHQGQRARPDHKAQKVRRDRRYSDKGEKMN